MCQISGLSLDNVCLSRPTSEHKYLNFLLLTLSKQARHFGLMHVKKIIKYFEFYVIVRLLPNIMRLMSVYHCRPSTAEVSRPKKKT